jgi:hypothetical protein
MSSEPSNARKRKPTTEEPEADVSSDDQSKSKARGVSTDTWDSAVASSQTAEEIPTANAASATIAAPESSMESIGQMIQDLFYNDNAKVTATLATLDEDLDKDKKKCDKIQAVGGCLALVQLVKNCLDKAIARIPAFDQVTKLNELAELTTLNKTLIIINNLSYYHNESRVGISVIGGVEAIVEVMQTFPKCQALQRSACGVLCNLSCFNLGKKKAVKSGGLQALLAALNNHLDSTNICGYACWTLFNIVEESKENTKLLISMGGATAVAKVRSKWRNNDLVQTWVRKLANLIGTEMNSWTDE